MQATSLCAALHHAAVARAHCEQERGQQSSRATPAALLPGSRLPRGPSHASSTAFVLRGGGGGGGTRARAEHGVGGVSTIGAAQGSRLPKPPGAGGGDVHTARPPLPSSAASTGGGSAAIAAGAAANSMGGVEGESRAVHPRVSSGGVRGVVRPKMGGALAGVRAEEQPLSKKQRVESLVRRTFGGPVRVWGGAGMDTWRGNSTWG